MLKELFTRFTTRSIQRSSTLRCPHCKANMHERMPTGHAVMVFHCLWCNRSVHCGPADHCVFCAFGSYPCPERQRVR